MKKTKLIIERNSTETEFICSSDSRLKLVIDKIGDYKLELRTDYFQSLAKSIVGQQLSIKASSTIWGRVKSICPEITPENILEIEDEAFRCSGVSRSKTTYIKNLSKCVLDNSLNFDKITSMENKEDIINNLIFVKGIGRWTAEMFLIFSLGSIDIFSRKDVGLIRALKWLYEMDSDPSIEEIAEIEKKWMPYRTVASLYLWEIVNRKLIDMSFADFKKSFDRI